MRPDDRSEEGLPAEPALEPELARELARLEAPAPPDAFRERMRRAFVRGKLEPGPAAAARPARRRWILAAAAAVLAAAILVPLARRDAARASLELLSPASVVLAIDGRELVLSAGARLELAPGARVESRDAAAVLRLDTRAVLGLAERSVLEVVALPASGSAETIELALRAGALRVATRAGFAPSRMLVRAPDADVRVAGTEFGVDVFPSEATCVCCTRGRVEVEPRGRPPVAVDSGASAWCARDGSPPRLDAVKPPHAAPIEALRAFD